MVGSGPCSAVGPAPATRCKETGLCSSTERFSRAPTASPITVFNVNFVFEGSEDGRAKNNARGRGNRKKAEKEREKRLPQVPVQAVYQPVDDCIYGRHTSTPTFACTPPAHNPSSLFIRRHSKSNAGQMAELFCPCSRRRRATMASNRRIERLSGLRCAQWPCRHPSPSQRGQACR